MSSLENISFRGGMDRFNIEELYHFCRQSSENERIGLMHMHKWVTGMLTPFFLPYDQMFDILQCTDAIIFGSFALACLFPGWTLPPLNPNNLNIAVSLEKKDILIYRLSMQQYEVDEFVIDHDFVGVLHTVRLRHNFYRNLIIVIMVSESSSAAYPIFRLHNTLAMNFVTSKAIYCAYPDLTLNRYYIINSNVFLPSRSNSHIECIAKDEQRGFVEFKRPFECLESYLCPHFGRKTTDTFGASYLLPDIYWMMRFRHVHFTNSPLPNNKIVGWKMGGFCTHSGEVKYLSFACNEGEEFVENE